jgi:hypothetical protein
MARKKTFLLNHELIDGIRFLDAEQFKAIICGLADIDERKKPETTDPIALAFINMQKGFTLENAEKWEKKCADAKTARDKRADLFDPENSDSRNENSDSSSVSVTDPVSVSESVSENDDDKEFDPEQKNSSSSPDFESDPDPPKRDDFPKAPNPPKREDPKQTSPPGMIYGDAAQVWEIIRNAWNSHNCRFTADKIYLNLSQDQRERVRGSMATYTPDQMVRGINKYFDEREKKPGGYEYKSFYLFIEKGLEFYVET